MKKPGVEMPDALQRQIRSLSLAFAEEVIAIVACAVGAVAAQCGAEYSGNGRHKKTVEPRPATSAARRSVDSTKLDNAILSLAKKHADGIRAEQINASLGTTSRDLVVPIQRMLADGRLTKSGSARGTRYYCATS